MWNPSTGGKNHVKMDQFNRQLFVTVLMIFSLHFCSGEMLSTLSQCCNQGSTRAELNHLCDGSDITPGSVLPLRRVERHLQAICQSTQAICCLRTYRRRMCATGIQVARLGSNCIVPNKTGGEYYKDCCDACKLGVAVRSKGGNDELACQLDKTFELGSPWHDAFRQCCIAGLNGTSPSAQQLLPKFNSTVAKRNVTVSNYDPLYARPLPSHLTLNDSNPTVSDRCSSFNNPCEQGCKDTGHEIVCTCQPGYILNELDGRSCKGNVDECWEESDDCAPDTELCVNIDGGYTCTDRDEHFDVNSHQTFPSHLADTGTDGLNTVYPTCPHGYEYSTYLKSCQDTDECALDTDTCDHVSQVCLNTIGSFTCVTKEPLVPCPPGHRFDDMSHLCVDIDECADRLDACNHKREFCLNLMGTYECHPRTGTTCPAGYKYNSVLQNCEDVDECVENLHSCNNESEKCRNVVGGYDCDIKCGEGFRYTASFGVCVDVDECAENLHNCDVELEMCINTQGAFECTLIPFSECKAGFKPQSGGCIDVDECEEGIDACDRNTEVCINGIGLYSCEPKTQRIVPTIRQISCSAGFRFDSSDTQECIDVDECEEGLHDCHNYAHTICVNIVGSFICGLPPCHDGFSRNLDTGLCQDVDECADRLTNNCINRTCVNTEGGYHCVNPTVKPCPSGHHYSTSEKACLDIDECELQLDTCNRSIEICLNTKGSYRCWQVQCPPGFRPNLSTKTCEDVDECAEALHNCTANEACVNQRGRFYCNPTVLALNCPLGSRHNLTTNSCQDIDECTEVRDACPRAGEECVNTLGSYECIARRQPCAPGFRMDAESRRCTDINECAENSHNCDQERSDCRNTHGGFVCQATRIRKSSDLPSCSPGFEYSNDASQCIDVDECIVEPNSCDRHRDRCVNTVGSFTCVPREQNCPSGYKFNERNRACEDVDECADNMHTCGSNFEQCHNEVGGYRCVSRRSIDTEVVARAGCSAGFQYSETMRICVDVNECQMAGHNCLATQRCDNTVGSFTCIRLTGCGTGYTLNAHTSQCEDDDECELGFHNCGRAYQCRNTLGSFRCERKSCPTGTRLVADGSCISIACGAGSQLSPSTGQCTDVNECEAAESPCKRNQRCINMVGTFSCQDLINCGGGYEMDQLGSRCVDIDECESGRHDCRSSQQCVNRAGGYICQCPTGYLLNLANDCEDLDECTRYSGKVCGQNAVCRNTPGSYVCDCNDGFQHGENNKTCVDVDECKLFDNVCQHTCVNTWGSYQCTCKPGYTQGTADKRTCIDVDECTLYKDRGNLCVGVCVNDPGSFHCTCPEGFTLGADKRTCQDVDECQKGSACRGPDETCLNTRGSYRCNTLICPPYYIRDSSHKNRCKRESTVCREDDLDCIKQPLSYSFNYLTFVSNLPIPSSGHVNLFTMRGPPFSDLTTEFSLELRDARAPVSIAQPATRDFFQLRRTAFNQAVVSLVRTIEGPQEIELELNMNLYRGSQLGGTALAKIYIFVAPYEF